MNFSIIQTRTGPSVMVEEEGNCYYLHSRYDPIKEASRWVEGINEKKRNSTAIVVIGMGAGHHIRALLQAVKYQKIYVYEFNEEYYKWIIDSNLISDLLSDAQISYHLIKEREDLNMLSARLSKSFLLFRPSIEIIPEKFKGVIAEIERYLMIEQTVEEQQMALWLNFTENVKMNDEGFTKNRFPIRKDMILVSAGPSLTKQISSLKKATRSNQFLVGCVGTAFRPLMNNGIKPDFVMISDPKDNIINQFTGLTNSQIPLLYLSTANFKTVEQYKGPRYIVWQMGFEAAEKKAFARNEPVIETGGSVATCLLDVMVKLGAKRIALIGQDLSFTDKRSHAIDTHAQINIQTTANLIEVPDYNQNGMVYTSKNLSVYLNWFKKYARKIKNIELWNCTEGGAYIDGWIHRPFKDFLWCLNNDIGG